LGFCFGTLILLQTDEGILIFEHFLKVVYNKVLNGVVSWIKHGNSDW